MLSNLRIIRLWMTTTQFISCSYHSKCHPTFFVSGQYQVQIAMEAITLYFHFSMSPKKRKQRMKNFLWCISKKVKHLVNPYACVCDFVCPRLNKTLRQINSCKMRAQPWLVCMQIISIKNVLLYPLTIIFCRYEMVRSKHNTMIFTTT